MCICISNYLFFGMAAGLAYLGIVTALTIDNQLTVLKSDCYERLAIGQRLNPKNVYKSFEYNTLPECQEACTKEQNACRAFSFGIGTKGNGTCELSSDLVRETADLKPIGTVAETDYDLYIKKLGCSVVIDKTPHDKPPPIDSDTDMRPTDAVSESDSHINPSYGDARPDDEYHHPKNEYPKSPYASNFNNQHYLPPSSDEVHHVQTLVSVASGPRSYLHPVHEILVGDGPYSYGRPHKAPRPSGCCEKNKECCAPSDLPPFRPSILNHPYDDERPYRPKPNDFDRPFYDRPPYHRPPYDKPPNDRPPYDKPLNDRPPYDKPPNDRPPYDKPLNDRPSYDKPPNDRPSYDKLPYDGPDGSYDRPEPPYDRPKRPHDRPGPSYDRPNSYDGPDHSHNRPGSSFDRPDPYDGPNRPHDRPDRPYDEPNRPHDRPDRPYDEPNRPHDRPDRPYDGPNRPDDRPDRPYDGLNRPHDRPDRPYDGPNRPHDRPDRPYDGPDQPHDRPDIQFDKPNSFDGPYDRPGSSHSKPGPDYDRPDPPYDRPNRPYDRPDSYDRPDLPFDTRRWDHIPDSDYDRPSKRPLGSDDHFKPQGPHDKGYDRPAGPFRPGDRPYDPSPNSIYYDRPPPPKYGSVIPHPDDYNKRPGTNGYPEGDRFDKPPRKPFYGHPNEPDYPGYHYDAPPSKPSSDSHIYGDNRPGGDPRPGYHYDKPLKPAPGSGTYDNGKPGEDRPGYHYDKPLKPGIDSDGKPDGGMPYPNGPGPSNGNGYGDGPVNNKPTGPSDPNNPNGGYNYNKPGGQKIIYSENGSIISTSIGPHGEQITSIITEIKDPCFRRVLAGKRAARRCVKRAFTCETVEQCQRECADEKYFICEGFNYRLDPTGRGKGDCELLDLPLSQLDIGRDLYADPEYDYYERDRNAASANCKQWPNRGGGYYPPYRGSYGGGGSYGGDRGGYDYDYGYYADRRYDGKRPSGYKGDRGPSGYDSSLRRPGDRWIDDEDYKFRRFRPGYDYDNRPGGNRRGDVSYHHSHSQDYENSRRYYHDRDRYDYQGNRGIHYLPAHYYKPLNEPDRYKPYEPYLPPNRFFDSSPYRYDDKYYNNRNRDRFWGLDRYGWGSYGNFGHRDSNYGYKYQYNNRNRYDIDRRNYYLPPRVDTPKDWGLYGGTYGNGGNYYHYDSYGNKQKYDYWGFYKYQEKYDGQKHFYGDLPPNRGISYLPSSRPSNDLPSSIGYLPKRPGGSYFSKLPGGNYLPSPPGGSYFPLPAKPNIHESQFGYGSGISSTDHFDNSILPAEPRRPPKYDFIRDECSLRSAAGFRLHKGIVKKFYAVPNIYECELLCFREKDFPCTSYAYRYTISLAAPTDNCYLSNRNYKELDYYTDIEPDRDFDIYTMNNRNRCEAPIIHGKDNSECFWRVRSGQRLDHKVVRDSLTAKSIVECQLECLRTTRFTCRAFSYRYGSPVIGGVIDNCQLTDWPYLELDPRSHFVPEPGFEVYERGSFGHGCEPDHFGIRNKQRKDEGTKVDQLCYIGFGSPARLLPQAAKKTLYVSTELECKAECSKSREGTLFQCMSFSYRSSGPKDVPNCQLSDILQRDLLPNVDYVHDPDYWLFAWDNYSPECIRLANEPVHGNTIGGGKEGGIDGRYGWDVFNALDTWRVYSVSGWPCRRGSLCQENREAGFWFCELEGGDKSSWDYCCRPDHQCGASDGYGYQWCYVGPVRTQWRKCSDRYYPYIHNGIGKVDISKLYLPPPQRPSWRPPSYRPGGRPDRPPALPLDPPPSPSLDEYEKLFEDEFLDPPKPGGFLQARHWPVSYLHKEMPPNSTDSEPRLMRMEKNANSKYAAIQNLINVIKNNDLKNVQYHIANESNNAEDILFVKIPLPTNFTEETKSHKRNSVRSNTTVSLQTVYSDEGINIQAKRSHKALPFVSTRLNEENKDSNYRFESDTYRSSPSPVYRRGFVTRANITEGRLAF